MRKTSMRVGFLFTATTAVIVAGTGCNGSSPAEPERATGTPLGQLAVGSRAKLPACDDSKESLLAYVVDEKKIVGVDTNASGTLDQGEVLQSATICQQAGPPRESRRVLDVPELDRRSRRSRRRGRQVSGGCADRGDRDEQDIQGMTVRRGGKRHHHPRLLVGTRQDMAEALAFAAAGKVKADIELQPFSSVNHVLDRLEHGDVASRVVPDFTPG